MKALISRKANHRKIGAWLLSFNHNFKDQSQNFDKILFMKYKEFTPFILRTK